MNQIYANIPWAHLSNTEIRRRQDRLLKNFIQKKVAPFSPYYKKLFHDCEIDPASINRIEDLQKLPFTDKSSLTVTEECPDKPRQFVLQPTEEQLRRDRNNIIKALVRGKTYVKNQLSYEYRPTFLTSTTGRSAEPVPFLYTQHDIKNLGAAGAQIIDLVRGTREDRILNTFPFAPHLGFWLVHYAAQTCGIFSLSTGGGKSMGTDGNLRLLKKIRPTVLVGMPTFIYHLFTQAMEEKIQVTGLQKIILGGEKVPNGLRRKLHALATELGSPNTVVMATYGLTEAKMAWIQPPYPSADQPSGYMITPQMGIIEVVDPETGEVLPENTPGEIVFTPLDSRGSVVLRYRTGDFISEGLTTRTCPLTGLSFPRLLGKISRKSEFRSLEIDKVKGSLVDFNQLEHILDDIPYIRSWQMELRKRNNDPMQLDELIINVHKEPDAHEKAVIVKIKEQFAKVTEIQPNAIFFYTAAEMRKLHGVGKALKEEKIVDNRAKACSEDEAETAASKRL